jgi:2-polyprenyl-3-methyl-5-hydroxy-6-metoxy-1,4-benzoquinol methylase
VTDALEAHLRRQRDRSRDFFWHRLRWRAVRAYLPEGSFELVDVGAGAGILADYLARDRPSARYAFAEPVASLREALVGAHGGAADRTDAPDFRSAGVVVLLDVLEHIDDDDTFLAHLVGKMAPGARLLVTVPALPRLWSRWDELLGHRRRYTKRTLTACADRAALHIDECNYLFPELLPLALWRARSRRTP